LRQIFLDHNHGKKTVYDLLLQVTAKLNGPLRPM
jgi:hypothetical protein